MAGAYNDLAVEGALNPALHLSPATLNPKPSSLHPIALAGAYSDLAVEGALNPTPATRNPKP